jgi:signal transduction histidine kinase
VQPAADAKGICITRDVDRSVGPFHGDSDRLNQVLLNLVCNAIKFTPAGGSIQLRLRGVADAIELEVADSGRGIAPALLPCIFEPFRQGDTPNTLRHDGLGLGLSIVKRLVEAHGGTITADSPGEGRGSTFRVRLPNVTAQAARLRSVLPDDYS